MAPALGVFDESSAENRTIGALGKTTSGKRLKIRTYPKFDSLEEERLYRKQHLAAAFRIFADRGFDEGVAGHISVRDPILTDHFCMSRAPFSAMYYRKRKGHQADRGNMLWASRVKPTLSTFLADLRLGSHPRE
jgi:hypothetical protein